MKYEGDKFCLAEYGIDDSVQKINEIKYTAEEVKILDMQDFDNKASIIDACNSVIDTYECLNELSIFVDDAKQRLMLLDSNFGSKYYNTAIENGYNMEKNLLDPLLIFTTPFTKMSDEELKKYIDDYMKKNPELRGMINSDSVILESKLEELANWYIKNVPTYQKMPKGYKGSGSRAYYQTPYGIKARGDDCTEFVGLYMSYICGTNLEETYSGGMIDPKGDWAKEAAKYGWKAYTTDEIGELHPGDVLVAHSGSSIQSENGIMTSSEGQHAEVYLDNNETFGWGQVQETYPSKRTIEAVEVNGQTHYKDSDHDYITVYRYEGNNNGILNTDTGDKLF